MTLPVWISAAAALVTAAVTRFVAPVWSLGPHGETGTSFLQSVCANAADPSERVSSRTPAATSAVRAMIETPFRGERQTSSTRCAADRMPAPSRGQGHRLLRRVRPVLDGAREGAAHSPPMPSTLRVVMLLMALAMLIG